MTELSSRLNEVVAKTKLDFANFSDEDAGKASAAGRWSRKQILGHLIDSASNNHLRFVRALLNDEMRLPRYDQEGCVRVHRYQDLRWTELLDFWASYNRLLAHVLAGVPSAKRATPCYVGDLPVMTLEELAVDYLKHMEHHLAQLKA